MPYQLDGSAGPPPGGCHLVVILSAWGPMASRAADRRSRPPWASPAPRRGGARGRRDVDDPCRRRRRGGHPAAARAVAPPLRGSALAQREQPRLKWRVDPQDKGGGGDDLGSLLHDRCRPADAVGSRAPEHHRARADPQRARQRNPGFVRRGREALLLARELVWRGGPGHAFRRLLRRRYTGALSRQRAEHCRGEHVRPAAVVLIEAGERSISTARSRCGGAGAPRRRPEPPPSRRLVSTRRRLRARAVRAAGPAARDWTDCCTHPAGGQVFSTRPPPLTD